MKKDIESWPFKVVDQDGSPMVEVEYLGENKTFSPQEISSMVLLKVISLKTQQNSIFANSKYPLDEGSCRSQVGQEGF